MTLAKHKSIRYNKGMTAISKVKRRLWMSDYKVIDVTTIKFINAYDIIVEGIYRVAVRELPITGNIPIQIDVIALVEKGKITFYKEPYMSKGKLYAEMVDTSPVKIFIKNGKHTNNILRRKKTGSGKTSTRNKRTK